MESLPLHPLFVHVPLGLAVIIPVMALAVLVAAWRGWLPLKSWGLVAVLQLILIGSAFAAIQTGEDQEDRVHDIVGHDPLHEHEEAAELFFYVAIGVGVLTLLPLFGANRKIRGGLAGLATLGTLAVLGLGVNAGEYGGELVYVHGAASAYTSGGDSEGAGDEAGEAPEEPDHDEDSEDHEH